MLLKTHIYKSKMVASFATILASTSPLMSCVATQEGGTAAAAKVDPVSLDKTYDCSSLPVSEGELPENEDGVIVDGCGCLELTYDGNYLRLSDQQSIKEDNRAQGNTCESLEENGWEITGCVVERRATDSPIDREQCLHGVVTQSSSLEPADEN